MDRENSSIAEKPSCYIIVSGNPIDGLTFYGSFESNEEAVEFAEATEIISDDDWSRSERCTVDEEGFPVYNRELTEQEIIRVARLDWPGRRSQRHRARVLLRALRDLARVIVVAGARDEDTHLRRH